MTNLSRILLPSLLLAFALLLPAAHADNAAQPQEGNRLPEILTDLERKQSLLQEDLDALAAKFEKLKQRQADIESKIERTRWELDSIDRLIAELSRRVADQDSSQGIAADTAEGTAPKASDISGREPASAPSKPLVSIRYVYSDAAKAQAAHQALRERGVESYIAESGDTVRVYAGAYVNPATAMQHARRLGPIEGVKPDLYQAGGD